MSLCMYISGSCTYIRAVEALLVVRENHTGADSCITWGMLCTKVVAVMIREVSESYCYPRTRRQSLCSALRQQIYALAALLLHTCSKCTAGHCNSKVHVQSQSAPDFGARLSS